MKHPARTMQFDELWHSLQTAKAEGLVKEHVGQDGLRLFCYTESCVYDRKWNDAAMMARGLIVDPGSQRVVATPFPKFFNVGERTESIPDLPFETFEKLDGSLIIIFHHKGEWRCATKGSLSSDQARWAAKWLSRFDTSHLDTDTTYLAEAIYPENRIVVHYGETGLVLLGAYRGDGSEIDYEELNGIADRMGWRTAKRHAFAAVSELLAIAGELPASQEGFVIRFSNGLRLKVKGDEYCRIHRMVSRLTPLAMWEAMMAGDDLESVRRQLPEEFWADFDSIIAILHRSVTEMTDAVKAEADAVADLSDKEVGLRLDSFPSNVRRFIFPYRKSGGDLLTGRTRDLVFRAIRPDGNLLPGYSPSTAMNRVMSEAA